jgi:hypothetical protein
VGVIGGFALSEDHPVLTVRFHQALQEFAGDRDHARIIATAVPLGDATKDVIDQTVPLTILPLRRNQGLSGESIFMRHFLSL